ATDPVPTASAARSATAAASRNVRAMWHLPGNVDCRPSIPRSIRPASRPGFAEDGRVRATTVRGAREDSPGDRPRLRSVRRADVRLLWDAHRLGGGHPG